jgi:protein ImuA
MTGTDRTGLLDRLRGQIARIERSRPADRAGGGLAVVSWPLAVPEIDRHLGGGLARGTVHEALGRGGDTALAALPARFVAQILGLAEGPVVWIGGGFDVYGPGLARAGVDPGRLLCVATDAEDRLAVCEDAIRSRGVVAVVAELDGALSLTASRRLQLAAEAAGVTGFLIRRSRRPDDPALLQPTACATRWRIAALPSAPALAAHPGVPGVGAARWSVDLLRHRGGRPASWIMEVGDAPHRLAVAAAPAGRTDAAAAWRAVGPAAGHAVA